LILKSGISGKSRAVLPRRTSPPVPPALSGAHQARFSSMARRTAGAERTRRRSRPAKLITKTHNENILCSAIGLTTRLITCLCGNFEGAGVLRKCQGAAPSLLSPVTRKAQINPRPLNAENVG
jgi:hypothetical protein